MSSDDNQGLRALGDSGTRNRELYEYERPDPNKLETIRAPKCCTKVVMRGQHWTGLCPYTGQPDHGTIQIEYQPADHLLESKSLKLYLMGFRQFGMFGEHVVERVLMDIDSKVRPVWIRVYGTFVSRGDVAIEAEAYRGPTVVQTDHRAA